MNASYVIAITGASGSGQTTLVEKVSERLGDAVPFFFDDYAPVSSYPRDIAKWLQDGADPDVWQTPQMVADLDSLRRGRAVMNPRTGKPIEPATHIVMEEPFGRVRRPMAGLIDFVACIDLPLEVALARRLLRIARYAPDPSSVVEFMNRWLPEYIRSVRHLYATVNALAMAQCELVLDGLRDPDELAELVVDEVRQRRGPA